MTFGLVNLFMLFGLVAVAIPVIIHLLNRRRYQVIAWGAMQFLQISQTRRRRLFLEDFVLLLLRMGLIALLVLALAAPFAAGPLVTHFASRPNRDVVIILDCSASMGLDDGKNLTPYEVAREWAERFLAELSPGDSVAIVLAGQQPVPLLAPMTRDLSRAHEVLARLPNPKGAGNGPRTVQWAFDLLRQHGQHSEQDIVVLTDGQRSGWFDTGTLTQWKTLGQAFRGVRESGDGEHEPRLWLVTIPDPERAGRSFPNYYCSPLRSVTSQVWRYQPAQFEATVFLKGTSLYVPPWKVQFLVDNQPAGELVTSPDYPWTGGQVPIHFSHQFTAPGSHLVSVVIRPDPPADQRPPNYAVRDFLTTDNRCDLAVMVREKLRVLLVDGEDEINANSSTASLRAAFGASTSDGHPSLEIATVTYKQLSGAQLTATPGVSKPKVVVLADVPALDKKQQQVIEDFLAEGGSVLVAVGERVTEPSSYNLDLFQGGKGWLPARLGKVIGDHEHPDKKAVSIDVGELLPPLSIFRDKPGGGLGQARFPQWWKLERPAKSDTSVLGLLSNGDPLLIEKTHIKGRVLLCAVPLDRSWGSNLPTFGEYAVLVHELVYYLANTKSAEFNVTPGQPLRFEPGDFPQNEHPLTLPLTADVQRPDGVNESIRVTNWPLLYEKTEEPGIYRLHLPGGVTIYYVIEPDRQESVLTLASIEEREALQVELPIRYENDARTIGLAVIGAGHQEDIWWIILLGVIGLLCLEIAMTRRMVARREG
jgi:hypothetical protein